MASDIGARPILGELLYVAGIIIIESPCCSTEESDYKSLSYDSKGNYVQQMRDRDTLIEQSP